MNYYLNALHGLARTYPVVATIAGGVAGHLLCRWFRKEWLRATGGIVGATAAAYAAYRMR